MKAEKVQKLKRGLTKIIIFVVIWEVSVFTNLLQGSLPDLRDVIKCLGNGPFIFSLFKSLGITLKYTLWGLLVGGLLGYIIGILMGLYSSFKQYSYNLLNGLKSIPVTIMLPLIISIFGLESFAVPTLAVPVFAIMAVNMGKATEKINTNRTSLANLLSISKWSYFKNILFWETLDELFSSLRIVLTYVLALQIAFEYFLQHKEGIGKEIYLYYHGDNHLAETYTGIFIVAFFGIVSIKILDLISKRQLKWKTQI